MEITIHRGINQIGGCITEIASKKTRIFIDLGQNLPDGEGTVIDNLANSETVARLTKGINAIFYTHYHGDHLGLFPLVPDSVPQYIGKVAKQVILRKHKQLSYMPDRKEISEIEVAKIKKMIPFAEEKVINIGDIKITPYFVSHSAYDAYMFLIEVEGKRILHTGDFRGHGYLSKGLFPTIEKHILRKGKIDFLITEGTMLSRLDERVQTENELKNEVIAVMKEYKNIFILTSSTDLEKLASFYSANKETSKKPFVCDSFQKDVLKIFSDTAGKKSNLFDFDNPIPFNETNIKLIKWMKDTGFCMLVRATKTFDKHLDYLEPLIDMNNTLLIFSMWKEYINPNSKHANSKYLNFLKRFKNVKQIHTSGHASAECLAKVCSLVNPTSGIIPIHSEVSVHYNKLPIADDLKAKIITSSQIIDDVEIKISINERESHA